jgi:hypothetical protein
MNDVVNLDTLSSTHPKLHSLGPLVKREEHQGHFSDLSCSHWMRGQSGGLAGRAVGIEELIHRLRAPS